MIRPTKAQIASLKEAWRAGVSDAIAIDYAEIDTDQWAEWCRLADAYADYELVSLFREKRRCRAESQVFAALKIGKSKDWKAAAEFLRLMHGYAYTQNVRMTAISATPQLGPEYERALALMKIEEVP